MPRPVQPPRRHVPGAGGVVQHHQPPAPAAAVPAQRLHRRPDRGRRVDQPPRGRPRGVLLADPVGLLGVDPPHRVVVPGEPPRVLRRQLRLAHPARTVQGVHHRPARPLQPLPQPHQHPVPAGERLVRARDRPPHRRQHPRQPRPLRRSSPHGPAAAARWPAGRVGAALPAAPRAPAPAAARATLARSTAPAAAGPGCRRSGPERGTPAGPSPAGTPRSTPRSVHRAGSK